MKKEIKIAGIDINMGSKIVSIALDIKIIEEGTTLVESRHRCTFAPGQIEDVKKYIGKKTGSEITMLKSLWTKEAIEEHKKLQEGE